jgi:hypothetical protein
MAVVNIAAARNMTTTAEGGAANAVCLDFSVAKQGFLTAYRWSGETDLSESNLVFVAA